MAKEMIEFYKGKLALKESRLSRIQQKENAFYYEMSVNETIKLHVLQAEVQLIKEVIEDFEVKSK